MIGRLTGARSIDSPTAAVGAQTNGLCSGETPVPLTDPRASARAGATSPAPAWAIYERVRAACGDVYSRDVDMDMHAGNIVVAILDRQGRGGVPL